MTIDYLKRGNTSRYFDTMYGVAVQMIRRDDKTGKWTCRVDAGDIGVEETVIGDSDKEVANKVIDLYMDNIEDPKYCQYKFEPGENVSKVTFRYAEC